MQQAAESWEAEPAEGKACAQPSSILQPEIFGCPPLLLAVNAGKGS